MQRRVVAISVATSVLFLMASGCAPWVRRTSENQSQTILVTSQPPGALISVRSEDGSRTLGRTPVSFTGRYHVVKRTTNKGACAAAGAAHLSSIALDNPDGRASEGEAAARLIFAILGAGIGAAAGAAECEAQDVVAVEPFRVNVHAFLDGHFPQEVSFQIPKQSRTLHFELIPVASPGAGPALSSLPGGPSSPRLSPDMVTVLDIQGGSDWLDAEILEELNVRLVEALADELEHPVQRAQNEPSIGLAIITQLVKTEQTCLLSSSLVKIKGHSTQKVVGTMSVCEEDELEDAVDRLVEELLDDEPPVPAQPPADWNAGSQEEVQQEKEEMRQPAIPTQVTEPQS